jgi:uncharacterized protein (DUF885 family)
MDKKLDELSGEYLNNLMRYFPLYATAMGIHDYDEEMPEGTLNSMLEFRKIRYNFYNDVKSIEPECLSFDGKIDREALLTTLDIQIFEDEAHKRLHSFPGVPNEIAISLYTLLVKEFAPLEERLRRITRRLEKIPRFIENSKELLTDPIEIWLELGIEESKGTVKLIELIQEIARKENISDSIRKPLDKAAIATVASLYNYATWLCEKVPVSRSNFHMKEEDFNRLIELRNLGMSIDEMLRFSEETLKETREMERELVSSFAPGKSVEEFREIMRAKRPKTFAEALEKTKKAVIEARQFVVDSKFVTIPNNENLEVIETPEFARSMIPFGAYMVPGKFDKNQVGYYWLTSPTEGTCEDSWTYCLGALVNTSIHEGYPGHHLHLVCANSNKSKSRILTEGIEFTEGWAHYCEEMTAKMGFSSGPEVMLERYNDIVWRAVRINVDIKLSRGEMSFDEAAVFLRKETGFSVDQCNAEIKRYTYNPGYQLSYLIGKKRIKDILEKIRKEAGDRFDLTKFHDTMLYSGILPISCLEKVVRNAFALQESEV